MARIYAIDDVIPVIDPSAFVHPDAVVIGDVVIESDCYIGPCACLRGDFAGIRIAPGAKIQDTSVIHSFPGLEVFVGERATVGHGAILHGCVVKKNALIGMGAIVMDNAVVGENSMVAALSFVKAGMQVGSNLVVSGRPAKVVREVSQEDLNRKKEGSDLYLDLVKRSNRSLREVEPLPTERPSRRRLGL